MAYAPLLSPYLHRPNISVLEIGVQDGLSLGLWRRLFPQHGRITAIGYGKGKAVSKESWKVVANSQFTMYTGDQGDPAFLRRVDADLAGHRFDVIIDDGSHVPWHQVFTLAAIFGRWLSDGGIYVIEDVETSYWDHSNPVPLYGTYNIHAGPGTRGSAVEKLKQLVDVINRRFTLDPEYSVLGQGGAANGRFADHDLATITFARNAVVLTKKVPAMWSTVDSKIDSKTAERYRPFGVHESKRTAFRRYRQGSSWTVEGTAKAVAQAWTRTNLTHFDALLCCE